MLIALGNNALSKAGGNFTLASADVNFGTGFGLVVKYIKSVSSNISTTGVFRLANNEGIGWRNFANAADILLLLSASDRLTFGGVNVPTISSTDILTNKTLTSPAITTPTGLVKGDVGLGNVDNTSDANKPVSTAQAAATTAAILAERSAAVQLLNHDYDGGTASNTSRLTAPKNTLTNLTALTRKQGTLAYDTTSNKLVVDNGTSLVAVGSGSGGTKNYVPNPNDANANWTPSSAGVTVTTESTTSFLPDNASQTTGIKIVYVSGTNPYAYTRWTMDAVDYTVLGQILMDATTAAAAGVFQVELWTNTASNYSGTSTKVTLSSVNLPTGTSKFIPVGAAGSSTAPYMELRIVATAAGTLYLNNVTYTPGVVAQSAVTEDWKTGLTFTPTGFGSPTILSQTYQRVNNRMIGSVTFTAGAPTTTPARLGLPTGYTVDTNLMSTTANTQYVGSAQRLSSGANSLGASSVFGDLFFDGSTTGEIFIGTSALTNAFVKVNADSICVSGERYTLNFNIPISQWAGQVQATGAGAIVEYAYNSSASTSTDTTSFASGLVGAAIQNFAPAGNTSVNKRVQFNTAKQPGDIVQLWFNDGITWMPASDRLATCTTNDAGSQTYGYRVTPFSATQYDVNFFSSATAATSWGTISAWKWVLVKFNPSAPVGVLVAGTDGSAGYAQAGSLPGLVTGATIAAGRIGEKQELPVTVATNFPATTQFGDFGSSSISLTAGVWLVSFQLMNLASGATMTAVQAGLSTTTGNSSSGLSSGVNLLQCLPATASTGSSVTISNYYVNISSTTVYYGKVSANYSTGTPQYCGRLTAVRIA